MADAAGWLALLLGVCGSICTALHIALEATARGAVEEQAARAGKGVSKSVARVLDEPALHARAVGLLKSAFDVGAVLACAWWVANLRGSQTLALADLAIALAVSVPALWTLGVLVPMSVAGHTGARLILGWAWALRLVEQATLPVRSVGRVVDEVVRRLAGEEVKDAHERVQDAILSVVEEGEQKGALDERDREMIEAVMRFSDLTVGRIMTPRTEVQALETTNNLGALIQAVRKIGHSRIPVYEESLDQIIGMFYVKDLMKWLAGEGTHGGGKPFELRSVLRPAVFVPETKTVRQLLDEMIAKKVHIAVVADEYGGTAGLVTIEDILEEIVGDIKDEYEPGPVETINAVVRPDKREAELEASVRIADANDAIAPLGVEFPSSEEYDTVGGFVITTLGRIPTKGEKFTHERLEVVVLEARPTRVVRVGLKVAAGPAGDEQGVESGARAG